MTGEATPTKITAPESIAQESLATESDPRLLRRLQGLLLVRLVVATTLLGGMLYVTSDRGYSGFTSTALTALIALTFGGSALFGGLLLSRTATAALVGSQLGFDLLLATGFVYLSGAASSFFTSLYGVTILAAAVVSSPLGTRVTTVAAVLLYLVVAMGIPLEIFPPPPDQPLSLYTHQSDQLGFVVLANLFGLGLVGVLSERLATRLDLAGASLRKAKELTRGVVESLTSGLLTMDLDGTISSANTAAARLLGSAPDVLVGLPANQFLPLTAEHGRGEGEATSATGDTFPVGYTSAPLRGEQGALVLFTDLTEIRSLREAASRAERLATLGRLASGLAHEIRNPLGAISGSVQMVRDSVSGEDKSLLDLVLSEVDRLNDLVTQMLHVARPPVLRRAPTRIHELCTEVVMMACADESFRNVRFRAEGSSAPVNVDSARFRQLIWNLLKNAAQASPPNGEVSLVTSETQGSVILTVSDEGDGIDESKREDLFDMFSSGHDHGIGLGLAVVRQIVDTHGAAIHVTNGENCGAHFVVEIPLEETPNQGSA
ncbi:MAG: two-component system sensor histidine kinase PilS (NtrC family) [Polyangiales bacterium]|jgi:two-component system sensor histidine kinase PilS (NtrC family)